MMAPHDRHGNSMDKNYSGRASGQARGTPQSGSARALLAAVTRLRGSPGTLQEISALGGRARPRAHPLDINNRLATADSLPGRR